MRKLKKTVLYPVMAAVIGTATAGALQVTGVLAYFTNKKDSSNKFTVAENVIRIDETFPDPTIVVGTNTYTKEVKITNTGTVPCYTRVFLEFSDNDVRSNSTVSTDGTNYYPISELKDHLPNGWVYVNSTDDALSPYYYYTGKLAVGASTPILIKSVKTTFADEDDIEPFDIYVYAESVQATDRNGVDYEGRTPALTNPWRSAWEEYLS